MATITATRAPLKRLKPLDASVRLEELLQPIAIDFETGAHLGRRGFDRRDGRRSGHALTPRPLPVITCP